MSIPLASNRLNGRTTAGVGKAGSSTTWCSRTTMTRATSSRRSRER